MGAREGTEQATTTLRLAGVEVKTIVKKVGALRVKQNLRGRHEPF